MSSETKWPPGPWEYSGGGIWAKSPWNARVRILYASTFSPMNGVDSTAIGHAAAASPKLYEALAEFVPETQSGKLTEAERIENARTALASARGEG